MCTMRKRPIMLIEDMSAKLCQEFLERIGFGRLGCVHDNEPYVVPIYFAYEPDRLYGFSTPGRKIEWMRLNPRVCVEVDEVISNNSWTCVIASGRYEELPYAPQFVPERQQAIRLLEKRFLWWQAAYASEQFRYANKTSPAVIYCIHLDDMTGRRALPDAFDAGRVHQKTNR
jgi:uncharacterized protein